MRIQKKRACSRVDGRLYQRICGVSQRRDNEAAGAADELAAGCGRGCNAVHSRFAQHKFREPPAQGRFGSQNGEDEPGNAKKK